MTNLTLKLHISLLQNHILMIDDNELNRLYPDHQLSGRTECVYHWLDMYYGRLLDAGCSYGYATRYYTEKCNEIYAIDIDPHLIEIAKKKYSNINFIVSAIEKVPFPDNYFDMIVFSDVLEHTSNQIQSLNELYRVLKIGGDIIITAPHKGLFTILDPYNYGYYLMKYLPFLYRIAYRIIKGGNSNAEIGNPQHNNKHYHYSEKELFSLLDKSAFANNYQVIFKKKSGLLLEPLTLNFERIMQFFTKEPTISKVMNPFRKLTSYDYRINYSFASYNLAIKINKIS